MRIQCSNCGASKEFRFNSGKVLEAINEGWGSYGSALYCPECTKTWYERNDKDLADKVNTMSVIYDLRR
jgi:hypothetical protein